MFRSHAHRASALAAALLSLGAAVSAGGLPIQTPVLVAAIAASRGGWDGDLDEAARLAATGQYEEAFDALDREADSLRTGIIASLAGEHETAIAFLRRPSPNPYLERVRLLCAARSFLGAERFFEAIAAVRAIPYPAGMERSHLFRSVAMEIEASALASCDSLLAVEGVSPDAEKLSGKTQYALARALLRAGNDSIGAEQMQGACRAYWAPEDREAFEEALSMCERYYGETASAALRQISHRAFAAGLPGAARRIVERLLDRDARDLDAMFLKARILEAEKKGREAEAIYDRIIEESASSEIAKVAHRRLISLEYDLGRRERAVELCREHADRFGDASLLSLGARIDISLGRLDRAFSTYREILGSGSPADGQTDVGDVAAAAALGCVLGRSEEAYRMIVEHEREAPTNEPGAQHADRLRRATPSILYWLWRTAPDASERGECLSALVENHPRSLYAFAARAHIDSLFADMSRTPAADRIARMAAAETRYLDSLASVYGTDSVLDGSAAYAAYRYFLDCGLPSEASECVAVLNESGYVGCAAAVALYREARNRGFHHFAMVIFTSLMGDVLSREPAERLKYPVAFPIVIAAARAPGIPAELVLAVMREESAFDPNAVSGAGAIGLMQLMPSTARWMARKHGWSGNHCNELRDPACNAAMGSRYLAYLLGRSGGSLVAAIASYNGGEGRMSRWRKQFDPAGDPMAAMELIGPRETRAYTKRVLTTLCRYRGALDTREAAER